MTSALFWFRRDLRDHDNAGLFHALKAANVVYCVFVFDRDILRELPTKADRRVEFIWESVAQLKAALQQAGGDLIVRHAAAVTEIPALAKQLGVTEVHANEDYEPAARTRDDTVAAALEKSGIAFRTWKDQVIFAKDEVLTQGGTPFSVFTPYKNAWIKLRTDFHFQPYPVWKYAHSLAEPPFESPLPTLEGLGFRRTNILSLVPAGMAGANTLRDDFIDRMERYADSRDYPAVKGGSYLSMHNRFGTISIRELAGIAWAETLRRKNPGAETWLSELIWRDFYFQIIWHHPNAATSAFKSEYDAIKWPGKPAHFRAWCEGRTGYPIVDAGMRQLNFTGFMHNRLRMIVASFLVKDLLIDWRKGEQYFAEHLNDFDLSANNGGWQWRSSTGCDAQPYFRIFHPVNQSEKFDPQGAFIRRYVPEMRSVPDEHLHSPWNMTPLEQQACNIIIGKDYPAPIVDHAVQRVKALALYKGVKGAPAEED